MDQNKIIIIALIAIIAILLVGIAAVMPNLNKKDTNLDFKSKSTLSEGDYLKIKLTDVNGNAIVGQTVNVTITDKNQASDYHSVVTNSNGNGKLKLDKSKGKYDVTVTYGGNDDYNGCNATESIKIKEAQQEEASSAQSGPAPYAYKSDGTPMYSQSEVDNYMYNKYGFVNYHVGSNGYIDMDEPGYDDAGNYIGYY
ncbi:Ig-like domain-containing protein [Methanobrevibacter sp.]|uniref:Ig-like domain-containing protein n=1 Tax=Methanobrevibacter sp. TaxID=66852 RepID=UPI0025E2FB33|nr:Ig-like domain-containing protein [Methanobrevibacter sp.]MBR4448369.1 hypothetical protein [Methanobrevibacter sp.]